MVVSRQSTGHSFPANDPIADAIEQASKRQVFCGTRLTNTTASGNDTPMPKVPCTQQTTSFFDLSPELRNHIYEAVFAQHSARSNALIVASPSIDKGMTVASQPAIARACRQTRAESLSMFYATSYFEAYIADWDFKDLCRWVRCLTSSPDMPQVTVHVRLLDRIICEYQLLKAMRLWRDVEHSTIRVIVHDETRTSPSRFDQRRLLSHGLGEAEDIASDGDQSEVRLREASSLVVWEVARYLEGCDSISFGASTVGCRKHGIGAD